MSAVLQNDTRNMIVWLVRGTKKRKLTPCNKNRVVKNRVSLSTFLSN